MEEERWSKDTKLYLVFKCSKCDQYSYVRPTQKTKKCLRCGRVHQVKNLGQSAIKVKGISEALKEVQTRQNILGIANFRAERAFALTVDNNKNIKKKDVNINFEQDNLDKFLEILNRLTDLYSEFPLFMIDLMVEDTNIPKEEVIYLINSLKKENILKETINGYFTLKKA